MILFISEEVFLTTVPFIDYLRLKRQEVKDIPIINESYTYIMLHVDFSNESASSNSSRAFAHVTCHVVMSKYFTRKGHTTRDREYFDKIQNVISIIKHIIVIIV